MRKLLVILIADLLNFDVVSRLLLIILILFIYVYYQIKIRPYFTPVLNDIEFRSLTAILTTAFFSLIYHFKHDEFTRVITSIIILLANIYFLYMWIIQVLSTQYETIVIMLRFFPKLQHLVVNIKREFDCIEEEYNKKGKSTGRLTATDKVRLSISKAMSKISNGIGNQRRSIERKLSKMIQHFNYARPSINKT